MSSTTPNLGLFKYDPITDGKETFSITTALNNNWDLIDKKCRGGLEVCDIGMALYVDETKGLRRYLNGQVVDINTNTQAFLNRLLQIQTTNPEYFTTEDNWQAESLLNIDGCVYKFVLNYSGETVVSVRLPKYPDYVEINAGGTLPVVGNGMTLGFTNGVDFGGLSANTSNGVVLINKDLYGKPINTAFGANTYLRTGKSFGITTDGTKSGLETTLNQTKLKMRYFIQIATGSETENNIINDIELNNPYSLFECKYADHELFNLSWLKSNGQWNAKAVYSTAYEALQVEYNSEIQAGTTSTLPSGVSYTKQGLSVKLSTEEYTDYDFVLNTANETFRLPVQPTFLNNTRYLIEKGEQNGIYYRIYSDGYCEQWGVGEQITTDKYQTITLLRTFANTNYNINVTGIKTVGSFGTYNGSLSTYSLTVSSFQIANNDSDSYYPMWKACGYLAEGQYTPLNDSILLYYYVGETVQNANLIDAGRIGEQLANKQDMLEYKMVDSYINGTSGYNVWKTPIGYYCEQWGRTVFKTSGAVTVNLMKTMSNTNYICQVTLFADTSGYGNGVGGAYFQCWNLTTTSFQHQRYNGQGIQQMWKVSGYLASGQY